MTSQAQPAKKKHYTREELEELNKDELVNRVLQLEAHNVQLRNTLRKHLTEAEEGSKKDTRRRVFDFSKHNRRHVLLRVFYLGWDYQGLATQDNTIRTIEYYLFEALTRSCLIENRQTCNYHRCGRTDKGVSAFCQPISLDLRSSLSQEKIDSGVTEGELQYAKMMNRLLPEDVKVLSWKPVRPDFSARFNCKSRKYKYFFPRGTLDIDLMNEAAKHLLGTHDFRNLCKLDVKNGVVNYVRDISLAKVGLCFADSLGRPAYDLCEITLKGKAFLWHQVRCIVGVLVLVGQKRESPVIIKSLLAVEENPCKPQYNMASDFPLNLFHCEYDEIEDVPEVRDSEAYEVSVRSLQNIWSQNVVRAGMVRSMLEELEKSGANSSAQADWILQGVHSRVYQPLLKRQTCESLEDRIEHFKKKQKLDTPEEELT